MKNYDKQAYKEQAKKKMDEAMQKLEGGLKDILDSEKYKNYLKTVSKFPQYSFNNCIMLYLQKPDSSLVCGYNTWKNDFNRQVKKGESALKIFVPLFKKTDKDENGDLLPDGKERSVLYGYKLGNVFDVSQTEGDPLPDIALAHELQGDVQDYDTLFSSLQESCPVPIQFENLTDGSKGYFSWGEQKIVINAGMSQEHTIKTLIHEMSHQLLHDPNKNEEAKNLSRNAEELEAESCAFVVCNHFGIDTSEYSFGYLAGWSPNDDMKTFKSSLATIQKTSSKLISSVEDSLARQLERGRTQTEEIVTEREYVKL